MSKAQAASRTWVVWSMGAAAALASGAGWFAMGRSSRTDPDAQRQASVKRDASEPATVAKPSRPTRDGASTTTQPPVRVRTPDSGERAHPSRPTRGGAHPPAAKPKPIKAG